MLCVCVCFFLCVLLEIIGLLVKVKQGLFFKIHHVASNPWPSPEIFDLPSLMIVKIVDLNCHLVIVMASGITLNSDEKVVFRL